MNAAERVTAALNLEVPDRVPVFPQIGDHAGLLAGLTYDVMYRDAERAAQAHLDALDRYGYDVVSIQVEPSWPVAEACGATVTYPPDKAPWITKSPVTDEESLAALAVPDFMATPSSAVMIEGTRRLAEQTDVPVAAFMTGPLTFSLQLMEYTKFITASIRKRDFAKRLVEKSVEIIHAYGDALRAAGASIFVICEHDVQMFSPADFRELSIDFLPDLLDLYPHTMLHLCGKVTPHLTANMDALRALDGLSMINVGSHVDLAWLKAALAGKVGVAGNVDHLTLLPHATPAEAEAAARRAIEAGKDSGGYMLAPGCEITADTPPANVAALMTAAATYGIYEG